MKTLIKRLGILTGTAILIIAAAFVPANMSKAAAKDAIKTTLSAKGDTLTVTISQEKAGKISSGRVTVLYDAKELKLSTQETFHKYGTEDVNTDAGNGTYEGVSYAFADASNRKKSMNLIKMTFKTTKAAANKKVHVITAVNELYSDDTKTAQSGTQTEQSIQMGQTVPEKVIIKDVTAQKKHSVKVSFQSVNGANGYEISRADEKDGKFKVIADTKNTTYTDTKGLSKGHTYDYKVRAYKLVKNKKVYGGYSEVRSVKVK